MDVTVQNPDNAICFSLDHEWTPDAVLEPVLELFVALEVPVTIFATHKTELLTTPPPGVEVGLHPNFLRNDDHKAHLEELLTAYPDAKGVRTHGLFEYANLLHIFKEFGLEWDSSQQLWMHPNLQPYRHPSGIARLPIYWEDDDYLALGPDWRVDSLQLDTPGTKILDFHPFWIFMNAKEESVMSQLKDDGYTADAAANLMNPDQHCGIGAMLMGIVDHARENRIPLHTIGEACTWV